MKLTWILIMAVAAVGTIRVCPAEPPKLLPFQGRLTDAAGNPVADDARLVQFKIYDAPFGGSAVWNGEVQKLSVNDGLVNTMLGTKANLADVDFNQSLYLELTIDANSDEQITMADPPLLPRQLIPPRGFAKEAANSRNLAGYDWTPLFGGNDPTAGSIPETKLPTGVAIPVGGVIVWWGGVGQIPLGFELCDGSAPTTPAAALQGNKPDLRDRFVKGPDSQATAVAGTPSFGGTNTIGARLSEDTVLSVDQIPPHPHNVSIATSAAGNHAHLLPIVQNGNQGTYGIYAAEFWGIPTAGGYSGPHARSTDSNGGHTHSVDGNTGGAGGGQSHNHTIPAHDNRPAFLEMFFIIRVK